jgi:hypothetical protein
LVAKTVAGDVPLCHISGKCHATEIRFSEHAVVFGSVVVKSTASRKVNLHNFGDLGSKFRFEIPPSVKDIVSIVPMEGYVPAMNDEILTVNFHPRQFMKHTKGRDPNNYVVDGIRCVLETHPPVPLTVTGRCIEQPLEDRKQLEFFGGAVRETSEQSFEISNPTGDEWKPSISVTTMKPDGQRYWKCTEDLEIPPGGKGTVKVTYYPLSMADESNPHRGQIFVATQDGGAFMYDLLGTASAPGSPQLIQADVRCKTRHQQAVPIRNWLHARQRFEVKYELKEPAPGSADASVLKIGGSEAAASGTLPDFDLPASLERPYKFGVYAHKVIPSGALISLTFTNPETGEFVLYDVKLTFSEAGSVGEMHFDTSCRQQVAHPILVENPLSSPATFSFASTVPDITFRAGGSALDSLTVPPKTAKGPGEKSLEVSSNRYRRLAEQRRRAPLRSPVRSLVSLCTRCTTGSAQLGPSALL